MGRGADLCAVLAAVLAGGLASAHPPPLLPESDVAALVNELSGEIALRNLEGIARFHRQRGSREFHAAAELIADQARAYGLSDVSILRFPADGKTMYGTQRSRPAWDAVNAELSEVVIGGEVRIASYAAEPAVLAEDSESADLSAELLDVGAGTADGDYAGRDVRGRIVLAAGQPSEVQDLAVGRYGAAGIVSYAQNQKTAWSGDNDTLIRWGHLQTFSPHKTFGFMVSLKTARGWQDRLRSGHSVRLHAVVNAGQHSAFYEVVTGVIPGADPQLKEQEIAFSCHLDHQRPGANDNASGCVTILEVARTLQKLISENTLRRPARTLRFIWPPEVEGTVTLLNAQPEYARRIRAVVHMDMVGGGPDTKAIFHVTRGPMSLPSFVHDVAWAFASWVNEESYDFAATDSAQYPLLAPKGGKEPLRAVYSPFTMGSDHDVYQDASFGIPSIYFNDWPDRYIHTNLDSPANIDPTKLKRVAFIGAASGYFLAGFSPHDVVATHRAMDVGKWLRAVTGSERRTAAGPMAAYERGVQDSLSAFMSGRENLKRKAEPRGPLTVFGYDYFTDHARTQGIATPKLLSYEGAWGSGEEYAYEARNFADGQRSTQQITEDLSAEYGDVPLALVSEYLSALRAVGLMQ